LQRLVPFLQDRESQGGFSSGSSDLKSEEEHDFIMNDVDYQKARRRTRDSAFARRHGKLHEALAEVVEDFGLLSFLLLDISSAESVGRVLARIDKSNGYVFTEGSINEDLFQCAIQSDSAYESVADVQERLVGSQEAIREGKR
jgi:hypothetical protein